MSQNTGRYGQGYRYLFVTAHLTPVRLGFSSPAIFVFILVSIAPTSPARSKMVKESKHVTLLKERLAAQKKLSHTTVGNELLKIQKAELELRVARKEEIAKRKAAAAKAAAEKANKKKGGN